MRITHGHHTPLQHTCHIYRISNTSQFSYQRLTRIVLVMTDPIIAVPLQCLSDSIFPARKPDLHQERGQKGQVNSLEALPGKREETDLWTAHQFTKKSLRSTVPGGHNYPSSASLNLAIMQHIFPHNLNPVDMEPPRYIGLKENETVDASEVAQALRKCSNTSAPGPAHVPYGVWNGIHSVNRHVIPALINHMHQQKKKVTPGRTPCSLCVRRSRRIERKLAFWVCGLLLGACGQGSMPPGRTRRNQGLRRYRTQKGSPDAKRFSGRNPIG